MHLRKVLHNPRIKLPLRSEAPLHMYDFLLTRLRLEIEAEVGRQMKTPKDFEYLSALIFERQHEALSTSTLMRLWGYVKTSSLPRPTTLKVLVQFLGYQDWSSFEATTVSNRIVPSDSPEDNASLTVPASSTVPESDGAEAAVQSAVPSSLGFRRLRPYLLQLCIVLLIGGSLAFMWIKSRPQSAPFVLTVGQHFDTYADYLSLFGLKADDHPWDQILEAYPHIKVWGPTYRHPEWHNLGDSASMMPTITEWWEPADTDSVSAEEIRIRNAYKFSEFSRVGEVRVTFMKNLVDSGFVFLGVYRLDRNSSDESRFVWERILEKCDLSRLDYLESLHN